MASFYETVKEINDNVDIVAVIGKYIKLTKQGANYQGVCPFHPDTSPSLVVSPKKHIWKCFVCGAKGNAISFVQQFKKCSLQEAVKIVAEDTGYDISKIENSFKGNIIDPKLKRLYDANKQVNEWYQGFLFNEENKDKLDYLLKRGMNVETIKQFQIGCAPADKTIIYNMLTNKNNMFGNDYDKNLIWTEQELVDAGIANVLSDGRVLDFFTNRITFPIYNNDGLLSGFSGRAIYGEEPKYLNTKETKIFNKSKIFYNMHNAIWEKSDKLILVEGYMDVIAFNNAGYKKVVGTMGVALSTEHLNKLRLLKDVKTIILGFDNDNAGKEANINIGKILVNEKMNVYVTGKYDSKIKDIDELFKAKGKEGVDEIIESRRDFITFWIDATFENKLQQDELIEKVNTILKFISANGDPLLKTIHLKHLADNSGISLVDLENKYDNLKGVPYKRKTTFVQKERIAERTTVIEIERPTLVKTPARTPIYKERILNDLKEIISLCISRKENIEYLELLDLHVINQFCPIQTKVIKAIYIMNQETDKITLDSLQQYITANVNEPEVINKYIRENIELGGDDEKHIMEYSIRDLSENILHMLMFNKNSEIEKKRNNNEDYTKEMNEYLQLKKRIIQ